MNPCGRPRQQRAAEAAANVQERLTHFSPPGLPVNILGPPPGIPAGSDSKLNHPLVSGGFLGNPQGRGGGEGAGAGMDPPHRSRLGWEGAGQRGGRAYLVPGLMEEGGGRRQEGHIT